MTIRVHDDGKHRILQDDFNPRIYKEEWRCVKCGEWVDEEEVVWAHDDGTLSTDTGKPWCVSCVPSEENHASL